MKQRQDLQLARPDPTRWRELYLYIVTIRLGYLDKQQTRQAELGWGAGATLGMVFDGKKLPFEVIPTSRYLGHQKCASSIATTNTTATLTANHRDDFDGDGFYVLSAPSSSYRTLSPSAETLHNFKTNTYPHTKKTELTTRSAQT